MVEPRILIAGTGRAGSTLLVRILTELGLDTGEHSGKLIAIDKTSAGGLEYLALTNPEAPRVVKDNTQCVRLRSALAEGRLNLDHVIIPIRDLELAAASRIRASDYGRDITAPGGLFGTKHAERQREALALMLYSLMSTLADYEVPHTLLAFPRFSTDAAYTHRALSFLTPGRSVDEYEQVLHRLYRPELVHQAPLTAAERRRVKVLALRARLGLRGFNTRPTSLPGNWDTWWYYWDQH